MDKEANITRNVKREFKRAKTYVPKTLDQALAMGYQEDGSIHIAFNDMRTLKGVMELTSEFRAVDLEVPFIATFQFGQLRRSREPERMKVVNRRLKARERRLLRVAAPERKTA